MDLPPQLCLGGGIAVSRNAYITPSKIYVGNDSV